MKDAALFIRRHGGHERVDFDTVDDAKACADYLLQVDAQEGSISELTVWFTHASELKDVEYAWKAP